MHIVNLINIKNLFRSVENRLTFVENYKKLSKKGEFFIIYPQTDVRFLTCPQNFVGNKCMKRVKEAENMHKRERKAKANGCAKAFCG